MSDFALAVIEDLRKKNDNLEAENASLTEKASELIKKLAAAEKRIRHLEAPLAL